MVWKSREWKRAAEQLQNKCRLLVGEFFSVVADEEARITRMELDRQFESLTINTGRRIKSKHRANSYTQL